MVSSWFIQTYKLLRITLAANEESDPHSLQHLPSANSSPVPQIFEIIWCEWDGIRNSIFSKSEMKYIYLNIIGNNIQKSIRTLKKKKKTKNRKTERIVIVSHEKMNKNTERTVLVYPILTWRFMHANLKLRRFKCEKSFVFPFWIVWRGRELKNNMRGHYVPKRSLYFTRQEKFVQRKTWPKIEACKNMYTATSSTRKQLKEEQKVWKV